MELLGTWSYLGHGVVRDVEFLGQGIIRDVEFLGQGIIRDVELSRSWSY